MKTATDCRGKRSYSGFVNRLAVVVAAGSFLPAIPVTAAPQTDYQQELAELTARIERSEKQAFSAPVHFEPVVQYVYLVYHKAGLTGELGDLRGAVAILDRAIKEVGPAEDLYRLRVHLDLKLHRVPEAKQDLERVPDLASSGETLALAADVAFQEGRYAEARSGYEQAIAKERTWDNLARLAFLESQFGDTAGADHLYADAEDEITAKEMRSFAWVELQRGLLEFKHGRFESAFAHYNRADRAYTGYWMTKEYLAELLGAEGKFEEAAKLYQEAVVLAHHPEIEQQLGDLYLFMGKQPLAKPWYDRALSGFRHAADLGEVLYYHHLSTYYADAAGDGAAALEWAQKDAAVRPGAQVRDSLAWAFYRKGDFDKALEIESEVLASGIKDPHLLFHAGMIDMAVGRAEEGKRLMSAVAEINPRFVNTFHVHR